MGVAKTGSQRLYDKVVPYPHKVDESYGCSRGATRRVMGQIADWPCPTAVMCLLALNGCA